MKKEIYQARREKLREKLREKKLGGMLVTLDANRYYLSGFELCDAQTNESSGCLVIMANGKDWLCTDPRYEEAAAKIWDKNNILIYSGATGAAPSINSLLRDNLKGTLGFESYCISMAFCESVLKGINTAKADGLVESLRVIKDEAEIELMSASMRLNHQLMEWVPGVMAHGRTEKQIAWDIEQFFRNNGAEGLSFGTIVGINANAALPHAIPGHDAIHENCCVLVDCGCRLNDYCSDQTRTFWVGDTPPDHFFRTMAQVKEAQRLAIEAIHPGVKCKDVYAIAYNYFDRLGVAKYFNHGLGHGIGLQTHEPPSLNPRSETVLQAGMIVSVEPGLYYPEWGGVRWEYLVLVTEDGCQIM